MTETEKEAQECSIRVHTEDTGPNEESPAAEGDEHHGKKAHRKKGKHEQAEAGMGERVEELEQTLQAKEEELKEQQDKCLRLFAEFDNYKKRNENEKKELIKTANEKLFKDLLPVLDSFDHALASIESSGEEDTEVAKGLRLIYKQLEAFMERHELQKIEAVGKHFDPHYHSALMQEESDTVEPGVVLKEYQKGYTYHGKVIRPTMAIVAKEK